MIVIVAALLAFAVAAPDAKADPLLAYAAPAPLVASAPVIAPAPAVAYAAPYAAPLAYPAAPVAYLV